MKTRAPVYPAYLDGTQRNREMIEAFYHAEHRDRSRSGRRCDLGDLADSQTGIVEATRRIQARWNR